MKLYYNPLSGHSHRVHLFLSILGADYDLVVVDVPGGAHKTPQFLKLNRFGQVPVLDDDGTVISDSNAILVYLAKKFGKSDWLPEAPVVAATVQRWLSVAAGEIAFGPAAARLITVFGVPLNPEEVIARAHGILKLIDAELSERDWIAAAQPTIADLALYGYIARAPEGNVDISDYRNVNAWLRRIEAFPKFVPFGKTAVGLSARS